MASLAHGQQTAPADMVLLNGAITVDAASAAEHEALAIRGEHILAVGTNAEIAALAQPQTTVVDLEGRRVIPGLIDSHMHLVRAGLTWNDELHWDGVASLDAALALIAQAAATQPEGSWIRVVGAWHPGQFAEKRGPSRAELNAVAPRHPVYVQMLYEDALINDAALRICEITAEISDPPGGTFERDAAGVPTGRIRGVPAFNYRPPADGRGHARPANRLDARDAAGFQPGGVDHRNRYGRPGRGLGHLPADLRPGTPGEHGISGAAVCWGDRAWPRAAANRRLDGAVQWRPWRCECAGRRRWGNHRVWLPRSRRINPI